MEADRQPGQPGKRISRDWKQTGASPARQKGRRGMDADRQPHQPGKSISREWKQTGGQASQAKG